MELLEFYCRDCDLAFKAETRKTEYLHPLYGPCSKNVANCPECNAECSEKIKPKKGKSSQSVAPSCGNGAGCSSCPMKF